MEYEVDFVLINDGYSELPVGHLYVSVGGELYLHVCEYQEDEYQLWLDIFGLEWSEDATYLG